MQIPGAKCCEGTWGQQLPLYWLTTLLNSISFSWLKIFPNRPLVLGFHNDLVRSFAISQRKIKPYPKFWVSTKSRKEIICKQQTVKALILWYLFGLQEVSIPAFVFVAKH